MKRSDCFKSAAVTLVVACIAHRYGLTIESYAALTATATLFVVGLISTE